MKTSDIKAVKDGIKLVEFCGSWFECIGDNCGRLTLSNIVNGDDLYVCETSLSNTKYIAVERC